MIRWDKIRVVVVFDYFSMLMHHVVWSFVTS